MSVNQFGNYVNKKPVFIRLLTILGLYFCLPVFAQQTTQNKQCTPDNATQISAVNNILPIDRVVGPWTNETPRDLRSTETIDSVSAMRADLSFWAPVSFDSNGQVSAADYDFIEFTIRSSIDNPPVNVIASSGVTCGLSAFAGVKKNQWTRVQIPLVSLGLTDQPDIGRLKLKSTVSGPFTLWLSSLRLFSTADLPQGVPPADSPDDIGEPGVEDPPAPVPTGFVEWHLDPGVRDSIDQHIPTTTVRLNANGHDRLDDTASFVAALDSIAGGGIVDIPPGNYYISDSIKLTSDRQVLRGAGSHLTRLIFTESLPHGIAITGQYPQAPTAIIDGEHLQANLLIAPNPSAVSGRYALLTDSNSLRSQIINIVGTTPLQSSTRLTLAEPLNSHFSSASSLQVFDANEFSGVEALSLDVLSTDTHVADMIHMRSAAHVWVRDVVSKRARQSHVFTRQTYHCEITGNTILEATGHGDGKQGYGIDLANSTTGCLVENNLLGYLRHSILFNASANGNVVAFNHSFSPRHTNFAEGGPGDISFHSFAYANLVEGNVVQRIHIGDAGPVGEGNLVHRNCVTSGPLTIDNSPDATQSLYNNAGYGSNEKLQNTVMPPVLPETPLPRPYLQLGNTIFDNDGVTVGAQASPPMLYNNWFNGQRWNANEPTQPSFYGTEFEPILSGELSGDWRGDCAIPAVGRAAGH